MYTATIESKNFDRANNSLILGVSLTDGTSTFNRSYTFSPLTTLDEIKRHLKSVVDDLETAETRVSTVNLGLVDLDLPTIVPDPVQVALSDVARLKSLINLGLAKDTDQEYIDAVATYKVLVGK